MGHHQTRIEESAQPWAEGYPLNNFHLRTPPSPATIVLGMTAVASNPAFAAGNGDSAVGGVVALILLLTGIGGVFSSINRGDCQKTS
jgi:hypothetical protein